MDESLARDLIDAVAALTTGPKAATADQICTHIREHSSRELDPGDAHARLTELAHDGRIDAIDAAPGADGLPTRGYRPTSRSST